MESHTLIRIHPTRFGDAPDRLARVEHKEPFRFALGESEERGARAAGELGAGRFHAVLLVFEPAERYGRVDVK